MDGKEKRIDTDRVFLALGQYGRYQMQSFICANLISIFLVFQVMQMAFVNDRPKFYCTTENITLDFNETNSLMCEFYNGSNKVPCGSEDSYIKFDSVYGTTIATEWTLVCDKSFYSEFASSMFMIGVMAGASVISQMSDLFGRRWTFLLSTWSLTLLTFCQPFVQSYVVFLLLRFFIGMAYSGMGMIGWVISCENVTVKMRSYLSIIGGLFWSLGYGVLGVLAIYVRDWRMLSLYLSFPGLLSISFYWFVPETLHWYVATGKREKAEEWIAKAAKCNKTSINIEECYTWSEKENKSSTTKTLKKKNILHIFISCVLLPQFLAMCYLWMCNTFVYFGLALFSTKLSGDRYVNFLLGGLVEIPSYFVAAFSMEKLGRRMTSVIFHIMAGLSLLALMFVPEKTESGTNLIPLITTLSMIGKFAISVTFMDVFLYAAEIFPTTVRTVGVGTCSTVARIGAILSPYVGLLNEVNGKIVPAIFGVMALLAAAVTFFIAETKDKDLPEDFCDLRKSKLQTILCNCCVTAPPVENRKLYEKTNS